jgi:hypothetical protein
MQKDAEQFFALLDVNHDGEIDPDEITRYENVVVPEIRAAILAWPRSKLPRVKAAATTAVVVTIAAVVEEVSSGAAT